LEPFPPQAREAIRELVRQYEQRLEELGNRVAALEERLGASAAKVEEEPSRRHEEGTHSHERSHRQRVRVVVDPVKYRRHQRKKLFRRLAKGSLWGIVSIVGLAIAWGLLSFIQQQYLNRFK
jgi:hypothetical protein